MTDLSGMLEAERKRLKRKPKSPEQRRRERSAKSWWKNLQRIWGHAYLLSDEELQWLAAVTDATRDTPAQVSSNPWTGGRTVVRAPTTRDDAARAETLPGELWRREMEEQRRHRREGRRRLAERFERLGLQADRYTGLGDMWADVDSMVDKVRQEGAPPGSQSGGRS